MKAPCFVDTKEERIGFSLATTILAIILYIVLQRLMGRKSFTISELGFFEIKTILVSF